MKTLKISIPEKGKRAGTTAWVADQLSKIELRIKSNKNELPCVWYKLTDQEKWHILVKPKSPSSAGEDYMFYREYGELLVEYPQDPNCNVFGMFRFLTESDELYVDQFIEMIADYFDEYLSSDERLSMNLKVIGD